MLSQLPQSSEMVEGDTCTCHMVHMLLHFQFMIQQYAAVLDDVEGLTVDPMVNDGPFNNSA